MSESSWDEELSFVLGREEKSLPLPEGRGLSTEIDDDIIDRSRRDSDELGLRSSYLKMKSSEDSFLRLRMIILDKVSRDGDLLELCSRVGLHKKSSRISEDLRINEETVMEGGGDFGKGHER